MAWLAGRTVAFLDRTEFGTLDLTGPSRRMFEIMVPDIPENQPTRLDFSFEHKSIEDTNFLRTLPF
jgi:hypothetical protein